MTQCTISRFERQFQWETYFIDTAKFERVEKWYEEMCSDEKSEDLCQDEIHVHGPERVGLCWHAKNPNGRPPAGKERKGNGKELHLAIGDEEFLGPCDALPGVVDADGGRDDENEWHDHIVDSGQSSHREELWM